MNSCLTCQLGWVFLMKRRRGRLFHLVGSIICFTEKPPCRQPRALALAAPQILRMAGSQSCAGERSTLEGLGRIEAR